jgi:hypothetical protein
MHMDTETTQISQIVSLISNSQHYAVFPLYGLPCEIAATIPAVADREYSQRLSDPSSQSSVGGKTCKTINPEQSS